MSISSNQYRTKLTYDDYVLLSDDATNTKSVMDDIIGTYHQTQAIKPLIV